MIHQIMSQRYILFRRNATYYCEDTETHQQLSLRTKDEAEARTLLQAKNESVRQPHPAANVFAPLSSPPMNNFG